MTALKKKLLAELKDDELLSGSDQSLSEKSETISQQQIKKDTIKPDGSDSTTLLTKQEKCLN